jgi:hypothetical protein
MFIWPLALFIMFMYTLLIYWRKQKFSKEICKSVAGKLYISFSESVKFLLAIRALQHVLYIHESKRFQYILSNSIKKVFGLTIIGVWYYNMRVNQTLYNTTVHFNETGFFKTDWKAYSKIYCLTIYTVYMCNC